jgi:hypothetical protein
MGPLVNTRSRASHGRVKIRLHLLLASLVSVLLAACGSGGSGGSGAGDQAARADDEKQQATPQQETTQQATLPQKFCELLPKADAERIMGKALVEQRNDDSACHYRDARGTTGTGVSLDHNVLPVSDQCRLTDQSEPLSGIGSEACIAIGRPVGLYTTIVFGSGGQTFEVTAPGQDRASELATAIARVVLARLGA